MSELLKCPFCGKSGLEVSKEVASEQCYIYCKTDGCNVRMWGPNKPTCFSNWNTRPAPAVVSVRMPQIIAAAWAAISHSRCGVVVEP